MRYPKLHEDVYVPTSWYIGHGRDDVCGGLAQIIKIKDDEKGGINSIFVYTTEHPNAGYNWSSLMGQQEKLEKEFGTKRAYPDPDYGSEEVGGY